MDAPKMTANPFAALLDGVPRYTVKANWITPVSDGDLVRLSDVLSALAAAVPDDLAEAGKVAAWLRDKGPWDIEADGQPHEIVTALLARLAAQEAQIKGLEAERDEPHWDDHCVNQFAKMMREKMAAARAKGRSGWNDPNQCSVDYLRDLLYEHLDKGDPVDVANFCMMLRHYDASTRRDYGNTLDMWKARAEAAETALAAERAKVAKLVGAWDLARSHSLVKVTLGDGDARKSWGDFLIAMDEARAAITEAGQ